MCRLAKELELEVHWGGGKRGLARMVSVSEEGEEEEEHEEEEEEEQQEEEEKKEWEEELPLEREEVRKDEEGGQFQVWPLEREAQRISG